MALSQLECSPQDSWADQSQGNMFHVKTEIYAKACIPWAGDVSDTALGNPMVS